MAGRTRVLIADDHAIVREGLAAVLAAQPEFELVGEAADGVEAVAMARELRPDVILMDLVMPRQEGVAAIREIKRENPEARILVLTGFAEDDRVLRAIKSGALGCLLKDTPRGQMVQAMRDVAAGRASLHPAVALRLMREIGQPSNLPPTEEPLTEREAETLRLIARGMTNGEIAERLVVHERTIAKHVSSILSKLHLANRTQAALYALREGLASLD